MVDLFDRWKPKVNPQLNGDPCSRCGGTEETGFCGCGDRFCIHCIDPHFTEDDPDFCPVLREDPARPDLREKKGIDRGRRQ